MDSRHQSPETNDVMPPTNAIRATRSDGERTRRDILATAARLATVEGIRVALIALSENPLVHGILLQTPLPGEARLADLAGLIDPAKDVDGANPTSLGRLMTGLPAFAPATAGSTSPARPPSAVALVPTSTTTAPGAT